MSARRLPRPFRRRAAEDASTRAFLSAIRVSAWPTPEAAWRAAEAVDAERADDDAHPLPLSLVTLLVTP